jgi:hypothetical protein
MTATTFPATIHIGTRRFVGILVAVATMAATLTWALVSFATDPTAASSHTTTRAAVLSSLSPTERRYVEGIEAASPLKLAAAYGNAVDALAMTPSARRYVEAIMALTPAQLAATFGTGIVDHSARVLASLTPSARAYVDAIMAMSPEQLAASF